MNRNTILSILSCFFVLSPLLKLSAQEPFWLGADISWETEFESRGKKFYNYQGVERETTALMKEMGLNAVRLRVWVDPQEHGNWCNKEDVLTKALRAKSLGMEVMIDFHYSDWWADPAKQNIPKAWAQHKYKQMLKDVSAHTKEVLSLLKNNGISPKWVQVGNETSNGMLWPIGKAKENPMQYAGLFKAGYTAVKEICPDAKVIVHLDNGFDERLYQWNLDALRDGGAKWDIIGMSIYPYWAKDAGKEDSTARLYNNMRKNIKKVVERYGTDVMIVETGFEVDEEKPWLMEKGREQLRNLISICRNETDGHCLGVFYWEPTADPRHYRLGAFTHDGRPTAIMRAFTTASVTTASGMAENYDRNIVKIETTEGDITVELYNETPLHRDNFLKLVSTNTYEGVRFYRVISNFMIQTGDTCVVGEDGEAYEIPAEILPQYFHRRGMLCAARESDDVNPERKSSSSEFYISWGEWPVRKPKNGKTILPYYEEMGCYGTPWLDGEYTIFGEVLNGFDVVDRIQKSETDDKDRPLRDIRIKAVKLINKK